MENSEQSVDTNYENRATSNNDTGDLNENYSKLLERETNYSQADPQNTDNANEANYPFDSDMEMENEGPKKVSRSFKVLIPTTVPPEVDIASASRESFECKRCGKTFAQEASVARHEKNSKLLANAVALALADNFGRNVQSMRSMWIDIHR